MDPTPTARSADLLLFSRAARLDRWSVPPIANVDDAPRDAFSEREREDVRVTAETLASDTPRLQMSPRAPDCSTKDLGSMIRWTCRGGFAVRHARERWEAFGHHIYILATIVHQLICRRQLANLPPTNRRQPSALISTPKRDCGVWPFFAERSESNTLK